MSNTFCIKNHYKAIETIDDINKQKERKKSKMQRTKSIYEVKGIKFAGFDKETLQPKTEEVTYELENIRMKQGAEEESIEKALERKIGKREARKVTIREWRLVKEIIQTLSDELFEQYCTTEVKEYNE